MSIMPVMPSNPLILCCLLPLLPSGFPSIRVFSNDLRVSSRSLPHPVRTLIGCIRWTKVGAVSLPRRLDLHPKVGVSCPSQTLRRSEESWHLLQTPEPLRSSTEGIPESRNFRRVHLNAALLILKHLPGISYLTADARSWWHTPALAELNVQQNTGRDPKNESISWVISVTHFCFRLGMWLELICMMKHFGPVMVIFK